MNLQTVEQLVNDLIAIHLGGKPWTFKWIENRTTWGRCSEKDWTIQISRPMFLALKNPKDIMQTILHEIAHGIVGCAEGHNEVWKAKAREIGVVNPTSYSSYDVDRTMYSYKMVIVLEGGKLEECRGGWHRRPRKSLKGAWLPKRKEETMNRLWYVSAKSLDDWYNGTLSSEVLQKGLWK